MNVVEHNGLLKASRIAGPKHNYLGIRFAKHECDIQLTEKRLPDCKESNAAVSGTDVIGIVQAALADETGASGQQLYVSEIEFVPTDTPNVDAYSELARAIIKYAIENCDRVSC